MEYKDVTKLAQLVPEILCAQKKNIVVEYALRSAKNPVGVAEYQLTHKLPAPLKNILPSEKQFIEQIKEEMK